MMREALLGLALMVAVNACASDTNKVWRTATGRHSATSADSLRVRIDQSAGVLRITPANESGLYDYSMRYDAAHYRATREFDSATHTLSLRLDGGRGAWRSMDDDDKETARLSLGLTRGVPLDMGLRLGAVEAHVDLGGLAVDELTVESAASATQLRFTTPNPRRMRALRFDVGAAYIEAHDVGNANVERIAVDCGAGAVTLDFSGAWNGDADARVRVRLGAVTLRVPKDVGVRAQVDLTLGSFDDEAFQQRDGVFYSSNWESAPRRLTLDASMIIGRLRVERIE